LKARIPQEIIPPVKQTAKGGASSKMEVKAEKPRLWFWIKKKQEIFAEISLTRKIYRSKM